MQYPIDAESTIAAFEKLHGPASETARELFSLYVENVNEAYEAGRTENKEV